MASYSGIEIIRGVDKNNIGKNLKVVNALLARHAYEKAKKMAEWKRNMKEDYDEYVDDAPYIEPNLSEIMNFENSKNHSFGNITRNSQRTRLFTSLALFCSLIGFCCLFIKGKVGIVLQILTGIFGFSFLLTLQYFVKATVPVPNDKGSLLNMEYTTSLITTEFALGYWVALFLFLAAGIMGILKLKYLRRMNST